MLLSHIVDKILEVFKDSPTEGIPVRTEEQIVDLPVPQVEHFWAHRGAENRLACAASREKRASKSQGEEREQASR